MLCFTILITFAIYQHQSLIYILIAMAIGGSCTICEIWLAASIRLLNEMQQN